MLFNLIFRLSFSITSSLNDFLKSLSPIDSARNNNLSTLMELVNRFEVFVSAPVPCRLLPISSECDLSKGCPCFVYLEALPLGILSPRDTSL